jgi:Flp pilus assembly protein TadG
MGTGSRRSLFGVFWQAQGSIALEFAIIIPVFFLMVFGIVDFGHAWYMDHLMSNASREGARYGTRFVQDVATKNRILPTNLTPSISNYVINTASENGGQGGWGLSKMLPADSNPQVIPSGPGWSETNPATLPGKDLTVTVTARKTWLVIGRLIPGLGSYKNMTVSTTMKCE